jgi:predicted amidophosphoribosyltransferase
MACIDLHLPSSVAIVDDVLTTGAHFKAMKRILMERFPEARIVGLFLARRVPNTEA